MNGAVYEEYTASYTAYVPRFCKSDYNVTSTVKAIAIYTQAIVS